MPNSRLFVLFKNRLYQSSTSVEVVDLYLKKINIQRAIYLYIITVTNILLFIVR